MLETAAKGVCLFVGLGKIMLFFWPSGEAEQNAVQ